MPKLNRDEKWRRYNEKLEKFMKENNLFMLATTYYEMADFLKKEGKDNSHLRKIGYQIKLKLQLEELNRYADSGALEKVEILASNDSCGACKILDGKTFTIKDAKVKRPIPVEGCAHRYGCRCTYLPVIKI